MPKEGPVPKRLVVGLLEYEYTPTACPASNRPLLTASEMAKAPTTAPAGSRSTLIRPPDISLIFCAKAMADSWKKSREGQPDCIFQTMGAWAVAMLIDGNLVAAAAAPMPAANAGFKNSLRDDVLVDEWDGRLVLWVTTTMPSCLMGHSAPSCPD